MSLPNIKDLQKVTDLLGQVDSLEAEIASLNGELERTAAEYKNKEDAEYKRLLEETKNRINLDKINEEIQDIRSQENEIRGRVESEIEKSVDSYFDKEDNYKAFIEELVSVLEKEYGSLEAAADPDLAKLLPSKLSPKKGEVGQLRIITWPRTYILDIDVVKGELRERLLTELLPK